MPAESFTRAGFDTFNTILRPVMDDSSAFKYNSLNNINNFTGHAMLVSSECSQIGYSFQEEYNKAYILKQTIHVKAEKMGHNMLTLNSTWSVKTKTLLWQ